MNIAGLQLHPLKRFEKESGAVLHMLRADASHFKVFGEIYFSYANPGYVKGWKLHTKIEQNFAVPCGDVRFVFFDDRPASPTRGATETVIIGLSNYQLLSVPNDLWYSFAANSATPAIIANCTTIPHDPTESRMLPLGEKAMPDAWDLSLYRPG